MGLFIFPCAGNVGCSPLPCMLMRALSVHIAHEIAGAARIRHSLRPLIGEGGKLPAKPRAQRVARTRRCVFSSFRDAPLGAGPESIDSLTLPSDGFSDAQLRIIARASHAPE